MKTGWHDLAIGGAAQWVSLHADDPGAPVLVLHGGPGGLRVRAAPRGTSARSSDAGAWRWTTVDLRGLARAQHIATVARRRETPYGVRTSMPMHEQVALTPITDSHGPALERLFQLYLYDFSELLDLEIGDDGLFSSPHPKGYWTERRYNCFLIHAVGRLAGFAIVDSQSRITGEPLWDMNQFFVLRRHRLVGVGASAAVAVFDSFPGRWEVREVTRNTPAQTFWRKVIGRYTGGRFEEVALDHATWRGPVQRFESYGR